MVFHDCPVFLCYNGREELPSHIVPVESDCLPHLLAAAINARKRWNCLMQSFLPCPLQAITAQLIPARAGGLGCT